MLTGISAKTDQQHLAAYYLKAVHCTLQARKLLPSSAPEPSDQTSEEAGAKPYAYQSDQQLQSSPDDPCA